jgi:hypothetical protein
MCIRFSVLVLRATSNAAFEGQLAEQQNGPALPVPGRSLLKPRGLSSDQD